MLDGSFAKLSPIDVCNGLRTASGGNGKAEYRRPALDSPPNLHAVNPILEDCWDQNIEALNSAAFTVNFSQYNSFEN